MDGVVGPGSATSENQNKKGEKAKKGQTLEWMEACTAKWLVLDR